MAINVWEIAYYSPYTDNIGINNYTSVFGLSKMDQDIVCVLIALSNYLLVKTQKDHITIDPLS